MMPVFYFDYDRREHFSAPQFNRMRHRYRGVRESHKINLEIDQIGFSLHKLYEMNQQFRSEYADQVTLLMEGGPSGVNDSEDDPAMLLGLESLVARIQGMSRRVKALEA